MKRIIAILLGLVMLLTGCARTQPATQSQTRISETVSIPVTEALKEIDMWEDNIPQNDSLDNTALLQYIEDDVYAELANQLGSDNYTIENITASYVSQEYLDELTFNSQSNIFFGYAIADVDSLFQGSRYVFTLDDDGKTTVQEMRIIEDTSAGQIIKNIAIGTGVILVCVTVSYFTGGAGTPTTVSMIFTAAAKSGVKYALGYGVLGGISAGIVKGYQTGDMKEALGSALLVGSEGIKWGAITGVVSGGSSKALSIYRKSRKIPTYRKSEIDVLNKAKKIDATASEQVSYLDGKVVSKATKGATRPDVVISNPNGTVNAIEVKNYNLANNKSGLLSELKRQVNDRTHHLPKGSTQEIVLDTRGRNYSNKFIDDTLNYLREGLDGIYHNIPIHVWR